MSRLAFSESPRATAPRLLLLLLAVVAIVLPLTGLAQDIGEAARERASQAMEQEVGATQEDVDGVITWVKVFGVLLLTAVLILLDRAAQLVDFHPFRKVKSNYWTPRVLIFFSLVMGGLLLYHVVAHYDYLLPAAQSEHGVEIDNLIIITTAITGVAFVAVQILLVYYTFRYRSKPGVKALYYPDNHKLELLWTIIPAVGLAGMIIPGLKYWDNYTNPVEDKKAVIVEVVGEQFIWNVRYPGPDNVLGNHDFRQITGQNPVGIDSLDESGKDDVMARSLHLPVNRPAHIQVRSKDVLHGFYLPHFRTNIYAVPGMPTQVAFTPTMTTAEAKEKYGEDFTYVVACSQLCGGSHYKMRLEVVVHTQEEYDKWVAGLYNPEEAAEEGTEEEGGEEGATEEGEQETDGGDEETPAEDESNQEAAETTMASAE